MSEIVETDGDTIYVIDQPNAGAIAPTLLYNKIDWLMLAKQKNHLITITAAAKDHPLSGLIDLLDFMQDEAEQRGYRVVYGYNKEEWEQDHGDKNQAQH